MYVSSFLELHTVLIAWQLHNVVFGVLWETGLLVLPILWMLLRSGGQSVGEEQAGSHETTVLNIKSTVMAILVLLFCLTPLYAVAPSDVRFQPPQNGADTPPPEVRSDIDPSTYRDHFGDATAPVRIPLWWALMHAISQGLTQAVIDALPTYADLREARLLFEARNIEDPGLISEYRDFLTGCYYPAKANHEFLRQAELVPAADPEDLAWAGSATLIGMPGGYASCGGDPRYCQNAPMPLDIQQSISLANRVGGNTCGDWWGSLRTGLVGHAREDEGVLSRWVDRMQRLWGIDTAQEQEDLAIRKMLENTERTGGISGPRREADEENVGIISETVGGFGALWGAAKAEATLAAMKQAMPILLAITMLILIVIIPFGLLLTGYRIDGVVRLSFLFFSLIFVNALLGILGWVDFHLTMSLYEDESAWSWFSLSQQDATRNNILSLVMATSYPLIPLIWLAVMSSVGIRAASGLSRVFETSAITTAVNQISDKTMSAVTRYRF